MHLINVVADLKRVTEALERIANAIETLVPPKYDPASLEPSTLEDLHTYVSDQGTDSGGDWRDYGPRDNNR